MTIRFLLLLAALLAVGVSTAVALTWIPTDDPVRVALAWFSAGGVAFVLAHLVPPGGN